MSGHKASVLVALYVGAVLGPATIIWLYVELLFSVDGISIPAAAPHLVWILALLIGSMCVYFLYKIHWKYKVLLLLFYCPVTLYVTLIVAYHVACLNGECDPW